MAKWKPIELPIEERDQMEILLSFLGAFLLLFLAGSAIISFMCGGILMACISLNEYLKSINR